MRKERKPRGEAILKNMADALQEEFYQVLRHTTQPKALAWLEKEHGIKASKATATAFWEWYPRSCVLRRAARSSEQLESTILKMSDLKIRAEDARKVAQVNFELLAAENRDPVLFSMLGKAQLENQRLQLEREKFEHAKKADWEKGLDALQDEIKGNAEAMKLFAQLTAVLTKAAR